MSCSVITFTVISLVQHSVTFTVVVSPGARIPSSGLNRSHGLEMDTCPSFGTKAHSAMTLPVLRSVNVL